jgi:Ca-activated chloride channel family protein
MRRIGMAVLVTGVILGGACGVAQASARGKNEEGNRLYEEKKYPEAMKRYTEAQIEAPDSPQLHYNLGNVFFRQGEIEKAREEYRRALAAADASLDPRAIYNLGNTFFSQQQYQEAVNAYQRTLKLSPRDMDAKRNLELALLRMKQQQQQQKQNPSQGKDQDKDRPQQGEKQKPDPSSGQDKNPKGASAQQQQDSKNQQSASPRPEKGELSREEAERILNALQEDEKANLKRRLQSQQEESKQVEEDW